MQENSDFDFNNNKLGIYLLLQQDDMEKIKIMAYLLKIKYVMNIWEEEWWKIKTKKKIRIKKSLNPLIIL